MKKDKKAKEKTSVLDLFFLDGKERALREAAREASISPMTASKQLSELVEREILVKTAVRNTLLFRLADNDVVKREKRIWNIARVMRSGIISYLDAELNHPTVILFGSVARGENSSNSDVDLFIITETKKEPDLAKYRSLFNAEFQVLIHTSAELKQLRKTSPELINNVLNGIVLSGYIEVL